MEAQASGIRIERSDTGDEPMRRHRATRAEVLDVKDLAREAGSDGIESRANRRLEISGRCLGP